jgi:hypothetical protein
VRRYRPGFGAPLPVKTMGEVSTSICVMIMPRLEKGLKMGSSVTIFRYFLIDRVAAAISILVTTGKLR